LWHTHIHTHTYAHAPRLLHRPQLGRWRPCRLHPRGVQVAVPVPTHTLTHRAPSACSALFSLSRTVMTPAASQSATSHAPVPGGIPGFAPADADGDVAAAAAVCSVQVCVRTERGSFSARRMRTRNVHATKHKQKTQINSSAAQTQTHITPSLSLFFVCLFCSGSRLCLQHTRARTRTSPFLRFFSINGS
jgi:hypothetical protein